MKLQNSFRNEFKNKKILITGGTGSIGIGLIKQLLPYNPKIIKVFTNDENSIFESIRKFGKNSRIEYEMGDIRDKERLDFVIRGIDIVFHAAAMKHVDICEDNPFDAVKTNVIGTSNIIESSISAKVSKFILISTDKATLPSTTLGASKLLAERLTINANSYDNFNKTIFASVRFGNVIGSRGSVYQIFLDQIRKNQALTVTDPRMTRFIMSIQDAAGFILKATSIAKGGEIFILKMPSVKIEELAKNMYEVCKVSDKKIKNKIQVSKLRDHERFHEYLVTPEEIPFCHDLGDMYRISTKKSKKELSKEEFSSETAERITKNKLKNVITELREEYLPF
jgi:FlaA1/EpsC-like NDP-sugar epimerase|tara:strand:- start:363 stop:1376 length:1014 start_codon:yes stop_codon:yes gene_type:complete